MRKILLTLFIIVITALKGNCLGIVVINTSTTITNALVSQNLTMSFDALGLTTVSVKALDNYVVNQSNTNIKFSVSKIFLNCASQKKQLQYGVDVPIFQTDLLTISTLTQPVYLTIEGATPLPAGIYTANLQFTSTNILLGSTSFTYVMTFTVLPVLEITSPVSINNITLNEDDVFLKEVLIKNVADVQINLKANQAWKLYIDTSTIGTLKGQYFVVVKTVSNVPTYQSERFELKPNQRYFLASGNSTTQNPPTGSYISTYLVLEYSFQNNNDSYVLEGTTSNPVKYSLEAQ